MRLRRLGWAGRRADRVADLVPFVHVRDVPRSLAFYELLGFRVRDTYELDGRLDWAALESGHAQLMLTQASAPVDPRQQAILFYLYAVGLDGLRERLLALGVPVGPIVDGSPGPKREMRLSDPDGYGFIVAQVSAGRRAGRRS